MQFSSTVTAITTVKIMPMVFDTVTKGSPNLMLLLQNAKDWSEVGGTTELKGPIQYQDTTNGGNTGIADQLDTDRQDVLTNFSFQLKSAYKPVVVADAEKLANKSEAEQLRVLTTQFNIQAKSLATLMAQNLYTGTGSGNAWDSLANAADDSTNYSTYGGLSRSTYTSWRGYYLGSAGALTLNKLATAHDAVSIGLSRPSEDVTTKAIWSTYEGLLTPTVRANLTTSGYPRMNAFGAVGTAQAGGMNQGFDVLFFRGTPVIKDEQCTSGELFLQNREAFAFYGADLEGENYQQLNFKGADKGVPEGVPGRIPSTRGFNFRKLMAPVNQFAEVGYVNYLGNFVGTNPRLLGQLNGAS